MTSKSSTKHPRGARPRLASEPDAASPRVEWLEVGQESVGQRIDNFLLAHLKGVPRSLVYRLLRRGEVRVNKGRARPSQRLEAGDRVRLPPLRRPQQGAPIAPSARLQDRLAGALLYEDDLVLVLNKPAGLAVHGGSGIDLGVIESLRAMRPGAELELVHRLDRDTSGCLLISKRRSALRRLHEQLREGAVDKRYLALLCGRLPRSEIEVTAALRTNRVRGGERVVRVDPLAGKPSRTRFRVRQRLGALTLVEAELETGRTHQIRVHAAHLGAAVAGDAKYGDPATNARLETLGLKRLFLHAAALSFRPREERPPVHVRAPLPATLEALLQRLEETPWT
ncbi:MAG: RluA family pseudouridine synthase [Halochromatium sp.]|uniref:RluA family pseudouridine synthase n=1 Tax=Halochromatium sp. TaxID=2049430 RepID=UPI003978B935